MKTMKNLLPGLVAMSLTLILLIADKLSSENQNLYSDLLFGVMALLLYSSEKEKFKSCLCLATIAFIIFLLPLLPFFPSIVSSANLRLLAAVFWIFADLIIRTSTDYKQIRRLFRNEQVWNNLQERSRLSYALLLMALLLVCIVLKVERLCAMLLCALFSLLFLRSVTGWSLMISRKKERFIISLMKGSLKSCSENDNLEVDAQMSSLYSKIIKIMDEKKPFLNESLSLEGFSAMLGTNKLYMSRTINIMSGKNFRQFINSYRIEYAKNLMRENYQVRIEEVSQKSGFHTLVTFDMAFRIVMDMTPSEWQHKLRAGMLK